MCVPHWNSENPEPHPGPEVSSAAKYLTGGAIATSDTMIQTMQTMRVPISPEAKVKLELQAARARAVEVVTALKLQSQTAQEKGFARADGRPDALRQVTGTSSLEAALAEANRVVEQYDRMLARLGGESNAPKPDPVVLQRSYRVGPATIARMA